MGSNFPDSEVIVVAATRIEGSAAAAILAIEEMTVVTIVESSPGFKAIVRETKNLVGSVEIQMRVKKVRSLETREMKVMMMSRREMKVNLKAEEMMNLKAAGKMMSLRAAAKRETRAAGSHWKVVAVARTG